MGKVIEELTPKLIEFIVGVPVFFVATAPLSKEHHVNVSPRAPGSSVVVTGPREVHWGDLSGSGAETAAHILENGRMTLLFVQLCEGAPRMCRLHGQAQLLLPSECSNDILERLPAQIRNSPGFRCVYRLRIDRVSTSCGYSMPVMKLDHFRTTLEEHSQNTDMNEYRGLKNTFSIDGLPSVGNLTNPSPARGPVSEGGYILAKPLGSLDFKEQAEAKRRIALLDNSPARAFSSAVAEPIVEEKKSSAAFPTSSLFFFAFALGFLLASALSRLVVIRD